MAEHAHDEPSLYILFSGAYEENVRWPTLVETAERLGCGGFA